MARKNKAEDERPWAIIIIKAPDSPHEEKVIILAVIRPI